MINTILDFKTWKLLLLEKRINALSRRLKKNYSSMSSEEHWEGIEKLEALQTQYQRLKYG